MALILIAFPRQEWLSELAYTYIACLVYSPFPTCSASSSFLPAILHTYSTDTGQTIRLRRLLNQVRGN